MYYTTPKEVVIEAIASEPTTFDLSKIEESLANQKIPNLKGLPAMEALVLLEKNGIKVTLNGKGRVRRQSLVSGTKISPNTHIVLDLS